MEDGIQNGVFDGVCGDCEGNKNVKFFIKNTYAGSRLHISRSGKLEIIVKNRMNVDAAFCGHFLSCSKIKTYEEMEIIVKVVGLMNQIVTVFPGKFMPWKKRSKTDDRKMASRWCRAQSMSRLAGERPDGGTEKAGQAVRITRCVWA